MAMHLRLLVADSFPQSMTRKRSGMANKADSEVLQEGEFIGCLRTLKSVGARAGFGYVPHGWCRFLPNSQFRWHDWHDPAIGWGRNSRGEREVSELFALSSQTS